MNISDHLRYGFSGPPIKHVANPQVDPVVDRQQRYAVSGAGPLSERVIRPATPAALAQRAKGDGRAEDAVRRVLQVVEDAAGGPAASARVKLYGVALSDSPEGLGANTYRAQLDGDSVLHASVRDATPEQLATRARRLGETTRAEQRDTIANVVAGWLNLGPATSATLLRPASAPPQAREAAAAVRAILHETAHVLDGGAVTGLSRPADIVIQEGLAELRSTGLPQLQRARRALGFDGIASDADLERAASAHRPYRGAEQSINELLRIGGVEPASAEASRIVSLPPAQAVEAIVANVARTGRDPAEVRRVVDAHFAAG